MVCLPKQILRSAFSQEGVWYFQTKSSVYTRAISFPFCGFAPDKLENEEYLKHTTIAPLFRNIEPGMAGNVTNAPTPQNFFLECTLT